MAFKTKLKVTEGKFEEGNLIRLGINDIIKEFLAKRKMQKMLNHSGEMIRLGSVLLFF